MSEQMDIVKEKFDTKWKDFKTGYTDLVKKWEDPDHIVYDDFVISQVHRAMMTDQYVFDNYQKDSCKIIEAACGNGFNVNFLKTKGYDAKGFDVSPTAIEDARQTASELGIEGETFELADHQFLGSLENESVDVIIALGLMRYLESDVHDYIYKESFRALRKGGVFIVSNDNYLFELFALNDGTISFWTDVISNFSDAEKLLGGTPLRDALEKNAVLPKRQYSKHSVSKHVKRHAENPLIFDSVVAKYGFRLDKNVYPDCNVLPPLYEREADVKELEALKAKVCLKMAEDWRAMFMGPEIVSFLVKD